MTDVACLISVNNKISVTQILHTKLYNLIFLFESVIIFGEKICLYRFLYVLTQQIFNASRHKLGAIKVQY